MEEQQRRYLALVRDKDALERVSAPIAAIVDPDSHSPAATRTDAPHTNTLGPDNPRPP